MARRDRDKTDSAGKKRFWNGRRAGFCDSVALDKGLSGLNLIDHQELQADRMAEERRLQNRYFLVATLLTVVIVATIILTDNVSEHDDAVSAAVKSLEFEVKNLDKEFCETINQMHTMRGFSVMNCEENRVILTPVENVDAK
jgi:hypothetical protein